MHKELEELWLEAIELKTDGQVTTYLRNHHAEYQDAAKRQKELVEQYPVIIEVLEGEGFIDLDTDEHRAFREYLNEQADMERLEREYYYYYGQSHVFSYGRILKQLQKEINPAGEIPMKHKLTDMLVENRTADAELDLMKTDSEYRRRRKESLRQEEILKGMDAPEEIQKQVDKVTGSIHDHWIRYGELIYRYAVEDILAFLIER